MKTSTDILRERMREQQIKCAIFAIHFIAAVFFALRSGLSQASLVIYACVMCVGCVICARNARRIQRQIDKALAPVTPYRAPYYAFGNLFGHNAYTMNQHALNLNQLLHDQQLNSHQLLINQQQTNQYSPYMNKSLLADLAQNSQQRGGER
jgi:hypothetical protein